MKCKYAFSVSLSISVVANDSNYKLHPSVDVVGLIHGSDD